MIRIKHSRKPLFWLGTGSVTVAVVLALAILFLNGSLAPRTVDAAPLAQNPSDFCSLFPQGNGFKVVGSSAAFCAVGYAFGSAQLSIGDSPADAQKWIKATMSCAGNKPVTPYGDYAEECLVPRVDLSFNDTATYDLHFSRGCYLFRGSSTPVSSGQDADARLAAEARSIQQLATQMDAKLKTMPPCPGVAQPPATQPPAAAGRFAVGHGCSYNEPRDSPGQLRCAAASTNEPQGAAITFKWMLDGQVQPEAGKPFTRDDQGITPGDHTITVLAVDTKSKQESLSSSFQFTKPGAALSVIIQCALRSGDDRAVACYADPKNMPDGAALTYEWMWNGATAAETGRTLNKDALTDGLYTIQVRAKDSKSGKTTSLASTTVQVGSPSKPGAAPAPKSAASFAVNVNCAFDSKMDEVLCSAKPVNTPADANLAYDWLWNGKTQGAKGPNLTVRVPVTYTLYTVQVRATDTKSGQTTPVVSIQIRAGAPPASPLEAVLSPEQWVAVNLALTGTPSPDPPEPVKAAAATAAGAAILGLLLAANNALSGAAGTASQVAAGVAGWLPAAGTGRPTSAPEGKTAGPPAAPPPPTTLPEQGGASIAVPPASPPAAPPSPPPPKPATLPEQKYTDEVLEEVIESVVRFDTPEQGMASALFPSPPPPKPTTLPEQRYTDQVLEEVIESIVHFDTLEQGSASIAAPPSPPPPKPTTLPERDCKQDPERDWMNEPIPGGGEG